MTAYKHVSGEDVRELEKVFPECAGNIHVYSRACHFAGLVHPADQVVDAVKRLKHRGVPVALARVDHFANERECARLAGKLPSELPSAGDVLGLLYASQSEDFADERAPKRGAYYTTVTELDDPKIEERLRSETMPFPLHNCEAIFPWQSHSVVLGRGMTFAQGVVFTTFGRCFVLRWKRRKEHMPGHMEITQWRINPDSNAWTLKTDNAAGSDNKKMRGSKAFKVHRVMDCLLGKRATAEGKQVDHVRQTKGAFSAGRPDNMAHQVLAGTPHWNCYNRDCGKAAGIKGIYYEEDTGKWQVCLAIGGMEFKASVRGGENDKRARKLAIEERRKMDAMAMSMLTERDH